MSSLEISLITIADVGTGTGIWLLDANEQLKDAELVGLDISLDAAPPFETCPSSIKLRRWDVRENVPEDLVGAFDIITVRFFAFVLLNDEVPNVVAKLYSMLSKSGPIELHHLWIPLHLFGSLPPLSLTQITDPVTFRKGRGVISNGESQTWKPCDLIRPSLNAKQTIFVICSSY
ncbi:hypothetical protein GGR57DRAFT_111013 [Xylariaceae sp. FL1272]|nr:hypothetical protein GGR57DRAFT_111013 [Xylariaceae sp. FL1272]